MLCKFNNNIIINGSFDKVVVNKLQAPIPSSLYSNARPVWAEIYQVLKGWRSAAVLSLACCMSAWAQTSYSGYIPYAPGEKLSFKLHYGFVTAGVADICVEPQMYEVLGTICYNMYVYGKGVGIFDKMLRIRDTWRTFVDTSTQRPLKSMRNIEEGKYKLREDVVYDMSSMQAHITRKHPDKEAEMLVRTIPSGVQDIVSGFYHLRRLDFTKMHTGDTIVVPAHFDKENYTFRIRYMGISQIKIDAGRFEAIKLVPVMPKNSLFDGDQSIKVWLSNDKNKIPLMAEAEMYVGSVQLELTKYSGLKHKQ